MWENIGSLMTPSRKNILFLLSCKHNHSFLCVKESVSSIQAISIFSPCIKLGHSQCTHFRLYQLMQMDFSFIAGIFIRLTEIMGFIVPHSGCFLDRVLVLFYILWAFRQKASTMKLLLMTFVSFGRHEFRIKHSVCWQSWEVLQWKCSCNAQLGIILLPQVRRVMNGKSYFQVVRVLYFNKIQSKCMKNVYQREDSQHK